MFFSLILSLEGLRLTNEVETREANAALGMCCFLIHLLQKKFHFLMLSLFPDLLSLTQIPIG